MEKNGGNSKSSKRTKNVAGGPRPGKIRHSRESHVDTEMTLVPYQPPASSSSSTSVRGNPRGQSDAETSSRTRKALVLDKEKRQSPPPYSVVDAGNPRPDTGSLLRPMINLSLSLPGWSVKAKRRQSSQSAPENQEAEYLNRNLQIQKPRIDDSFQDSEPQKRRIDALQIEPMWVNHSNSSSNSSPAAKKLKIVDQREKEGKPRRRTYYRELDDPNKYHKSVIEGQNFTVTKRSLINSNSEIVTIRHNKTRKKMSSLGDSEASTSETPDCRICGKSFGSHQALGGHMSTHNNKLIKNIPKPDNELKKHQGSRVGGGSSGGSKLVEDENAYHQCKVCKKTFPTGESLLGHMRCHWFSPGETPSDTPATASTAGGREVLKWYLSLAPPTVDDVQDEGGVNQSAADGFASCSHNSEE